MDTTKLESAVRSHLFFVDHEGDNFDRAQMAVSIYAEVGGACDAESLRGFLVRCGFSKALAAKVISDDEPLAIY